MPRLDEDSANPRLSIIVPVYREAATINEFIDHLLRLDSVSSAEILIVDGDGGSTLEHIQPRLRPLVRSTVAPAGRARQMNVGVAMARAPHLLFLHADARLPLPAIEKLSLALEGEKAVAGAFTLEIDSRKAVLRLIARVANWRTRMTRIPYGDQAIFITRRLFRVVGGFRDLPVMEDLDLMRRVKAGGWPILLLQEKVKVSPRRWEEEGIVYCTLRNWFLLLLYHLNIPPRLYAPLYPRTG